MRFTPLGMDGAWRIDIERRQDERGWFARLRCAEELTAHGIDPHVAQANLSWNERRGTLRGLHLQWGADAEGKHIRCTRGSLFDVLVDLRRESVTYCRWVGVTLTADERTTLYAPPGVAHGFVTLEDATEVEYHMTAPYVPAAAAGVRWDDPAFGIEWPLAPAVISERDRTWPGFVR